MDQRASTAPNPKGNKWLPKNTNCGGQWGPHSWAAICGGPTDSCLDSISDTVDRTQTCPVFKLTPEFHWNLNNSALKTLSPVQVEQLYGLFKFYDSSSVGDSLPSINCSRFIEIIRDSRLLATDSTIPFENGLQVASIEKIFAQATMGKLRVYLDITCQPALTFSLFCGALMNCAMLLNPSVQPEAALRQMLPVLLDSSIAENNYLYSDRGLIRHLSPESLWSPEKSQVLLPTLENAQRDFRKLAIFQEVIGECEQDVTLEDQKQEILERCYKIPDRLLASFHPDTIAHISSKFRVFDVYDSGTLPRCEVFTLLSSLGRHSDLPDPHAVLERLNTRPLHRGISKNGSCRTGDDASTNALTLSQLLQVVESTRDSESKRHSTDTAQLAAMKIQMDRATLAARSSLLSKTSFREPNASGDSEIVDPQGIPVLNRRKTRRSIGRRNGTPVLKSRKSILLSQGGESSNHLLVESNVGGSSSGKKRTTVLRRRSSIMNTPNKPDVTVDSTTSRRENGDDGSAMQSQRSIAPICTSRGLAVDSLGDGTIPNNGSTMQTPEINKSRSEDVHGTELKCIPSTFTVQVNTPLSVNSIKNIRIYLLLGGEHDGAIYCTISLTLSTREIIESEGIFYSTMPSETTRTTPVLPTQHDILNALVMLKKRVQARLEQDFELFPSGQLDIVEKMLQNLTKRLPHFGSPIKKSLRHSSIVRTSTPFCTSSIPDMVRFSPCANNSSIERPKFPPHPKLRLKLPNKYQDLFETWEISQHENYAWIHYLNSASRLKSAAPTVKAVHTGQLSPLRVPPR